MIVFQEHRAIAYFCAFLGYTTEYRQHKCVAETALQRNQFVAARQLMSHSPPPPHLYLRKVAALVHGELCPREHLLQPVQHIRPEVVLFHWPALVVDLVQHVHYPTITTNLRTFSERMRVRVGGEKIIIEL